MIVDRTRLRRSLGVREDGSEETSMTKQADFKARVRARMARTGESYATARAHLLASRPLPALHVTNGDMTVPAHQGHRACRTHHAVARRPARGSGARRARRRAARHPRRLPGRPRRRVRGARPAARRAPPRRLRAVVRGRPLRPAPGRPDPRPAPRARRAAGADHADLRRRAPRHRPLRRARRADLRAARPPARHRGDDAHASRARARYARLGRSARARAGRPRRHRRHPVARAAVRRRGLSTGSAASTPPPATGCR